MIPDEAVEAAREQLDAMGVFVSKKYMRAALEAASEPLFAPVLALADEMDEARGSIRGHVTTYQLRTVLGTDV